MCSLCGVLGGAGHWADSASSPAVFQERRAGVPWQRERLERARLLSRVLAHYGLSVDEWAGTSYVLRTRTGRSELVSNLSELWAVAERLLKRPCDPLDPDLLSFLLRER
jgi:hypothetical protein